MDDKISGIYCIKNIVNNKCYIGSSIDIKDRKRRHFSHLRSNRHRNKHLQNAYNQYSEENFVFAILEIVDNLDDLIEIETLWINNLPKDELYNVRLEAELNRGWKHTVEAREKMKAYAIKNPMSQSHKEKMIKANQERLGESKPRVNENNLVDKKVIQLSLDGQIIKVWQSMSDVERHLGIERSAICKVCKGKRKSTGGFAWKYYE